MSLAGLAGRGRPSLVIFDCDGVLVDTEPVTLRVMRDWLADCGLDLPLELVIDQCKGVYITKMQAWAEERLGKPIENFIDGYRSRMFEAFAAGIPEIPGATEALDALDAAGIASCVGSNGPHSKMGSSLKSSGLLSRFGGVDGPEGVDTKPGRIYSADDVGRPKPEPDLFLHAAEQMGFEPASCLVVEDSPSGIVAAQAAGMACVAHVDLTPRGELEASGPDAVIEHMAELAPLLGLVTAEPQ